MCETLMEAVPPSFVKLGAPLFYQNIRPSSIVRLGFAGVLIRDVGWTVLSAAPTNRPAKLSNLTGLVGAQPFPFLVGRR